MTYRPSLHPPTSQRKICQPDARKTAPPQAYPAGRSNSPSATGNPADTRWQPDDDADRRQFQQTYDWPYAELRRDAAAAGQAHAKSAEHGTTAHPTPQTPQAGRNQQTGGNISRTAETQQRGSGFPDGRTASPGMLAGAVGCVQKFRQVDQPKQHRSVAQFQHFPHSPLHSPKLDDTVPENDRCNLIGRCRQNRNRVVISSTGMTHCRLSNPRKPSADSCQRTTLLTLRPDSNASQTSCRRNWPGRCSDRSHSGRKCPPCHSYAKLSGFRSRQRQNLPLHSQPDGKPHQRKRIICSEIAADGRALQNPHLSHCCDRNAGTANISGLWNRSSTRG